MTLFLNVADLLHLSDSQCWNMTARDLPLNVINSFAKKCANCSGKTVFGWHTADRLPVDIEPMDTKDTIKYIFTKII